jgi:hypothetical protein
MDFSSTAAALRSLARRETVAPELRLLAATAEFLDHAALRASTKDAEAAARTLLASDVWEGIAVGLLLARKCIETPAAAAVSSDFVEFLFEQADAHLEHTEPRVRSLVASLLGAVARSESGGVAVYSRFSARLSEIIETNFERAVATPMYQISDTMAIAADDCTGWKVRRCRRCCSAQCIHCRVGYICISVALLLCLKYSYCYSGSYCYCGTASIGKFCV